MAKLINQPATQVYTPVAIASGNNAGPASNTAQGVAQEVQSNVTVTAQQNEGFNGISNLSPAIDGADYFYLELDNTDGIAVKTFVIGDPDGMIAHNTGKTLEEPTGGSTSPAAFKKSCERGYVIRRINYQTTLSANQFSRPFALVSADVSGNSSSKPMNVAGAKRPNNFNDKLLILDTMPAGTKQKLVLDRVRALIIDVGIGENVLLTFEVAAYGS